MSSIPTIERTLPILWVLAKRTASDIQSGNFTDWTPLITRLGDLTNPAWIDQVDGILPGWRKIAAIKNGLTAKHTLLVLATCLNLPEYAQADELTQHEIEWAAILHDIDKDLSSGRDASHPFKSAAVAAQILPGLGFPLQPGVLEADVAEWSDLVIRSQRPVGDQTFHDHTHLREIVDGMHVHWGHDTSVIRIMKAILFHQSLPTLKAWPNPMLLNDFELRYSLTLKDMNVLGPLLIADSDSWNLFDEPRLAYLDELRANILATNQRIKS